LNPITSILGWGRDLDLEEMTKGWKLKVNKLLDGKRTRMVVLEKK